MSDEEKKELDNIKESPTYREVILLRVIEKQQKEIEELKEIIKENTILVKDENGDYQELNIDIKDIKIIDKIKAKIKELDKEIEFEQNEKVIIYLHKQKRVLQSLLKEE